MGCVLSSPRTSAVDPTVQVSPATKMEIKGLFNTDAATQYVATTDHFQDGTWPPERTTRAEVGEQDTFVQSALLLGVETCGKGPQKESLLRRWCFSGCRDLRIQPREDQGLGSSLSLVPLRALKRRLFSSGSALAKFGFITVPGGRGGWGPAGLSRPCLQEAPMRSSNTRSSGRWTGPGFCVTRLSSCRSLKQRTTPATLTVSRDPGDGLCCPSLSEGGKGSLPGSPSQLDASPWAWSC